MAANLSDERREAIKADLAAGLSITDVARKNDTRRETVRNIKNLGLDETGAPEHFSVKSVSALVNAQGEVVQRWVKSSDDRRRVIDVVEIVRSALHSLHVIAPVVASPSHTSDDLLTVYNIADHHLGLYAWAAETGADYDLAVGERVLLDAMAELVSTAPASETAIVLNLGDFFHADNSENKTARSGNVLDVDTRYSKVLQVGVKLMIACIEQALRKHKEVIVRSLPGNHDSHTALSLSVALSCFFANNPRVEVDLDPSKFFFYQFGKVMLAATHGDTVKLAKFPGVMAAYAPKIWGATEYRYGYTGHIHNQRSVEENGASCEAFRTLAAKDAWHFGQGYSSGRSMVAITHHKDRGETCRHTVVPHFEAA